MLAGSHLIFANALFSNLTQNNLGGFILGVISHHLGDYLPHLDLNLIKNTKYSDYSFFNLPLRIKIFIGLEFLLGLFFTYYYFIEVHKINSQIVFFVSLGSLAPDLLKIFFKKYLEKIFLINLYFKFHKNFHFKLQNSSHYLKVLATQILILIISLIFFNLTLKV
jgi:hypothetical protein